MGSQLVLQKYDYARMEFDPTIQYISFNPGYLMQSSSISNAEIAITRDNEYRYLSGGLAGSIFGATTVQSMLTTTETTVYVGEYRYIKGFHNPSTPRVELTFGGTPKNPKYSSVFSEYDAWTAMGSGTLEMNCPVYWYYDEVMTSNGQFRPRLWMLEVRPGATGTTADPLAVLRCHSYSSYPLPLTSEKWLSAVNAGAKIPNDETNNDDGDWDGTSDDVGVPGFPATDVIAAGLLNVYKCDGAQLNAFAQELWDPNGIIASILQIFSNPAEAVISLGVLPFTPSIGSTTAIKVGNYTCTTATGSIVTTQWYSLDMGTFTLKEFYGSYLDYDSTIQIYLPYIGSKDLEVVDVMGATLHLVYHIDVVSGSVCAMLECTKHSNKGHQLDSVMYNWTGACKMEIPITSTNASSKAANLISSVLSIGGGIATAAATGGAGAAVGAGIAASGLTSLMEGQRTHYNRSGGIAADSGLMGVQSAYIMVTRPRMSVPSKFYEVKGGQTYASGYSGSSVLGSFSGMTVCEKVNISQCTATDYEKTEIERLCREGIIL